MVDVANDEDKKPVDFHLPTTNIASLLAKYSLPDTPEGRQKLMAITDANFAGLDGIAEEPLKKIHMHFANIRAEVQIIAPELQKYQQEAEASAAESADFHDAIARGTVTMTPAEIKARDNEFTARAKANDAFFHKLTDGLYSDFDNLNMIFEGPSGTGKSHMKRVLLERLIAYGIVDRAVELKAAVSHFKDDTSNMWNQIQDYVTNGGTEHGILFYEDGVEHILGNEKAGQVAHEINSRLKTEKGNFMVWLDSYDAAKTKALFALEQGLHRRFGLIMRMKIPGIEALARIFSSTLDKLGVPFNLKTADSGVLRQVKEVLGKGKTHPMWHHADSAVEMAKKTVEIARDRVRDQGQSWRLMDPAQRKIVVSDVPQISPDKSQVTYISQADYAELTNAGNDNFAGDEAGIGPQRSSGPVGRNKAVQAMSHRAA